MLSNTYPRESAPDPLLDPYHISGEVLPLPEEIACKRKKMVDKERENVYRKRT